jgi:thiol-disulfide isomerase/thioredoxin
MTATARRRWALAGVGVLAAAAGAGWNLWRTVPREVAPGAVDAVWPLRFDRPEGGELVMAELRGRPLLINFWATWCPPCIKEMPELDRFAGAHSQRLSVVGLAIDRLVPVQEFLARQPVRFAIGLAGLEGSDLGRQLGNNVGALPFTVLLDAQGQLVQRKLGETRYDELEDWLKSI